MIQIHEDVRAAIKGTTDEMETHVFTGVLPNYKQFVTNLAKIMPSDAEDLHHATSGMAGESGECLDLTKKVWIYGKPLDLAKLIEELGDLRFYYQHMLNLLGVTDRDIVANNMNKLNKRYAEGKYSDAQAIARADEKPPTAGGAGQQPRKFIGMPIPEAPKPVEPYDAARTNADQHAAQAGAPVSPYLAQRMAEATRQTAEGSNGPPSRNADKENNAGETDFHAN